MERELAKLVFDAEQAGLDELTPALEVGYDEGARRLTSMERAVAAVLTVTAIRRLWASTERKASDQARERWLRTLRANGIADMVRSPDLPDRDRKRWLGENEERFALLRDRVRRSTASHLRLLRDRGVQAVTAAKDLMENGLPSYHGRMRGRAVVIAQDQLWTLSGMIARHQQMDIGVPSFIWTTMEDSRVRDAHRSLHGREFTWGNLPSEGYPGVPINCRCKAVPVLPAGRKRS